ncbi:MAG: hypothetical protein JWM10_2283 [Myxococcaceae bacterium]|nr:hypothetical protein [Myxococcaceae bacterium]
MHWRDIDDGAWEGLTVTLTRDDLPARPAWTTDIVRPGRVRITAGGAARWWGRVARDYGGYGLVRGSPMTHADAVVRAITADEVRAVTSAPGTVAWWRHWSRWFVDAMVVSGRSPLRPGLWWVTPIHARDVGSVTVAGTTRLRDAPPSRWAAARVPILRAGRDPLASGDPWTENLIDENWGLNGSYTLLPLRRPSPADSGRVKAWRKVARDGALPPVLVHYVAALTTFALLDGHDRYAAARAEGVAVPWLDVTAMTFTPPYRDDARRAGVERQIERMAAMVPAPPTAAVNQLYALAYDDRPWPTRMCFGRPLAGGVAKWDEEVRRRLAELGSSKDGNWLFE